MNTKYQDEPEGLYTVKISVTLWKLMCDLIQTGYDQTIDPTRAKVFDKQGDPVSDYWENEENEPKTDI